jgi:hypothetical protein
VGGGRAGAPGSPIVAGALFVALGNHNLLPVSVIMTIGSILAVVMLWVLPLRDADRDLADEEAAREAARQGAA